jgi:hypothetical protein
MVTRRMVLSLLAFAPALALGAGSAQAFNPQPEPPGREIFLQDGTRVLVDKNNRVFVFQRVKDGTYKTKGGETLTVVNGGVSKRAGGPGPVPPGQSKGELLFQDGTHAIVDDNRHVFTFQPAKDGTYKTKDGDTITVVKGVGAIPPKEPWKDQKGGAAARGKP